MCAAAISPWECPTTATGCDAMVLPQPRERHHHRPQRGLHDIDASQRWCARHAAQHILQRPVDMRGERRLAGADAGGERGCLVDQRDGHPLPLAALTGKHEPDTTIATRDTLHDPVDVLAARDRVETVGELVEAARDRDRAMRQVRAPERQRADATDAASSCGCAAHERRATVRPARPALLGWSPTRRTAAPVDASALGRPRARPALPPARRARWCPRRRTTTRPRAARAHPPAMARLRTAVRCRRRPSPRAGRARRPTACVAASRGAGPAPS